MFILFCVLFFLNIVVDETKIVFFEVRLSLILVFVYFDIFNLFVGNFFLVLMFLYSGEFWKI